MRFIRQLFGLVSTLLISAQSNVVIALTSEEIYQIAQDTTVIIDGVHPGSGVIIGRRDDIYYVLTAKHVVDTEDEYGIITADEKFHTVNYDAHVIKFPDVDLAVVQFVSNKEYTTAQLTQTQQAKGGMTIHVSGFPNPGREVTERIFNFTSGKLSSIGKHSEGYDLVYTNITRAGMSGGAVLNDEGYLVGIHGRAEAEKVDNEQGNIKDRRTGWNLGIPIAIFFDVAKQIGFDLDILEITSLNSDTDEVLNYTPQQDEIPPGQVPQRPKIIRSNNSNSGTCATRPQQC